MVLLFALLLLLLELFPPDDEEDDDMFSFIPSPLLGGWASFVFVSAAPPLVDFLFWMLLSPCSK